MNIYALTNNNKKNVLNIALTIALLHLYLKWNNVKNIPNLFLVVSWKKKRYAGILQIN